MADGIAPAVPADGILPFASASVGSASPHREGFGSSDHLAREANSLPEGFESSGSLPRDTSSSMSYMFIDDLPDYVFEPEIAFGSDEEFETANGGVRQVDGRESVDTELPSRR